MTDETKNLADKVMGEIKSATEKLEASNADRLKEDKAALEAGLAKVEEQSKELEVKSKALEIAMDRFNSLDTSGEKSGEAASVEHKKAMASYMRSGSEMELKELSEGIDPEGGYTVSPATSQFVVTRTFETSPMRRVARNETISSPVLELLIDDDEFASLTAAEKEARGITDTAEFGLKTITLHECYAKPRATQMIIDDSALDIERWVANKAMDSIMRKENTAFITGNGVKEARGILDYAAWASAGVYERDALERVNSGSNGQPTVDGLIDTQTALKEEYQANAVWMMKRATWGALMKLKGTSNYHLLGLQPADRANNSMPGAPELLGKPVIFADDFGAVGVTGADAIAYGDFGVGYTVVDHVKGLRVLRDPYSAKPYIEFYTTRRTGGDVTNFEAIKINKLSA
jgi:HK97 family phage major capsid protein